jgi:hypothetical protein
MNKKLFALLTSAALMAGFAPSVFAADAGKTASLEFKGPATVEAGATADFDVVINANTKLDTIQFAFVTEGAEVQDFKFDNKAVKSLGFDDKGFKGKMSEQDKIDYPDNEDYQVMAFDQDFEPTYASKVDSDSGEVLETAPLVAPENIKIGTLTVKVADDATAVTVTTSDMKKGAGATGVANYEVDKFATWTTVPATATVGGAAPESSSEGDKSSSSQPDSSSETSKPESSSTTESKKDDSASSSSSSSSKNDSKSSSKATNGTTSNTNTGAASTAAVALAAAAAAMVVISKKRK